MRHILFGIPLILILLFLVSCNNQESTSTQNIPSKDSLKTSLLGKWGGLNEKKPVWEIKRDSIYYYEEDKLYPYFISNGNLIIKRADSNVELKNIHTDRDTLFFIDDQGLKIKGYRFRP